MAGSNTTWRHPALFQRIRKAKKNNPDLAVVVIEPRMTPTAISPINTLHASQAMIIFCSMVCRYIFTSRAKP